MDTIDLPTPRLTSPVGQARYTGREHAVDAASVFGRDTLDALTAFYHAEQSLMARCREAIEGNDPAAAREAMNDVAWHERLEAVKRRLHTAAERAGDDARLQNLLHDLKGGALTNAALMAEMIRKAGDGALVSQVQRLYFFLRDHLKISRNCIRDIDPDQRDAESETQHHSTGLLREKWAGYAERGVRVEFRGDDATDIASCCIEFATLDRVVYNLVNNAIENAESDTVALRVDPIAGDDGSRHLTIHTLNEVSGARAEALRERFGADLRGWFKTDYTTGGRGLGLRICAECAAKAYHTTARDALDRKIAGAALQGERCAVWVHWPAVLD